MCYVGSEGRDNALKPVAAAVQAVLPYLTPASSHEQVSSFGDFQVPRHIEGSLGDDITCQLRLLSVCERNVSACRMQERGLESLYPSEWRCVASTSTSASLQCNHHHLTDPFSTGSPASAASRSIQDRLLARCLVSILVEGSDGGKNHATRVRA